jgi:hypothetical protein
MKKLLKAAIACALVLLIEASFDIAFDWKARIL